MGCPHSVNTRTVPNKAVPSLFIHLLLPGRERPPNSCPGTIPICGRCGVPTDDNRRNSRHGAPDAGATGTFDPDRNSGGSGDFVHDPVMLQEILDTFADVPAGAYVDGTLGGAGHATAILSVRSDMTLVGIDRDAMALDAASQRLAPFGERVHLARARFDELSAVVDASPFAGSVSAVLLDLGVSSPQLDRSERGFSYRATGPLDMRMDDRDGVTASDIVNTWSHGEIARVLSEFGDERFAGRIASALIDARPVETTVELAEIVRAAIPAATRRTGGHPAKRTFQALRIAVNEELDQIESALRQAVDQLVPGGRGAVLAYHSGEDRIVKHVIADEESGGCTCPQRLPCACGAVGRVKIVPPRRRTPSADEQNRNPRAASAQLRVFERVLASA